MLTLATAYFLKVVLVSKLQDEIAVTGMWFIAILLDFVLLVGVLVLLGG